MSADGSHANGSNEWIEAPADNVGDAMIAAVAAGGIDHLFFTSGSEIGFFQESTAKAKAMGHNKPLRLITVPREHAALNAALGFAAVAGRPAITAGFPPTAFAGSAKGGRDEGGHLWMQETYDQHGIVRNYTKWDHRLTSQDNPGMVISRAIQVARAEPCGPVYLSFPKELTFVPMKGARFPSADQLGIPRATAPDAGAAAEIAERLVKAKNPVVVVSHSGRNPATVAPLVELAELLGLAVTDGVQRAYMSFPMRHPLAMHQSVLNEADAVLVLESEVPWVPGRNAPPASAWIASCGQDSIKLRIPTYEFTSDIRLTADPLLTIRAIAQAARGLLKPDDKARIAERAKRHSAASKARNDAVDKEAVDASKRTPIAPIWVTHQVAKLLDDNCVVLDETLPGNRTRDYLGCAKPGSYFGNPGSSGGWSPGAALGAKLAAPEKDVIAITGDGFYMFGTPAPALWAGAHYGAPFMMVVYTNRSYSTGTSRVASAYGPDSYAKRSNFEGGYFDPPIDFAKEAEAAGAYGETVRDPAEVGPALKRGLAQIRAGKPAVISMWLKRLEAED